MRVELAVKGNHAVLKSLVEEAANEVTGFLAFLD